VQRDRVEKGHMILAGALACLQDNLPYGLPLSMLIAPVAVVRRAGYAIEPRRPRRAGGFLFRPYEATWRRWQTY
jgi:hypothetical protein